MSILIKSGRTHSILSPTWTNGCARKRQRQKVETCRGTEAPAGVAVAGSQARTTGVLAPTGDPDMGTVPCREEKIGAAAGDVIDMGTVPDVEGTGTAIMFWPPPPNIACPPPP
jgi:hypothetical protein